MGTIYFINKYYYPDHSATAQLLTDLAEFLAKNNRSVHIVTSRQLYDNPDSALPDFESANGVMVHRIFSSNFGRASLAARYVDSLSFYVFSFIHLVKFLKKNDIVIAKTDPPLISIVVAVAAKFKGAKLVNWLQDLFPEIAIELDIKLISFPPVSSTLSFLRNWSLSSAAKNVVLGKLMANRVNDVSGNTHVIPNWVVGVDFGNNSHEINPLVEQWNLDGKFVVGYSGNLGKAHDYKTILESIELLKNDNNIIFLFVGGGEGYKYIEDVATKRCYENVMFYKYQPIHQLSYSLSVPDVHMISLKPNLEGLIVPSKYYGVLAAGKPLINIGDSNGEIGVQVRDYKIGLNVSEGDSKNLAESILFLKENPAEITSMSDRSIKLFKDKYLVEHSRQQWLNVIEELTK